MGIPAGLLMACFPTRLHALARSAAGLADLAASLQRSCLEDSYNGNRFTTAFLARYEPATHSLCYVNAGHNPPLLRRSPDVLVQLEAGGLPFGMFPNSAYEVGQLVVGPGDLLLMYTDGVIEAANDTGEQYGLERLSAWACHVAASSAECQRQLLALIDAFTGRVPQYDDMTCMIVQF